MKKGLLFVFVLFYVFIAKGQDVKLHNYESYKFDSYLPEWSHLVFDSTIIGDSLFFAVGTPWPDTFIYDGWSHFSPYGADFGNHVVIEDSTLYLLSPFFFSGAKGGCLESIDIAKGSVNWKVIWDFRSISNMEFPLYLSINNRNNLEIVGYRYGKEGFDLSASNNTLVVREFDRISGELLSFDYGDILDSLTKKLRLPMTNLRFSKSNVYPIGNDRYQYIEVVPWNTLYKSYTLDSKGIILNVDSIDIYVDTHDLTYGFRDNTILKRGDKGFVGFRYTQSRTYGRDSFDIFVDLIDSDFNLVKTKYLTEELDSADDYRLHWSDEDYFILQKKTIDSLDVNYFLFKHEFILYDKELNQLEKVILQDKNGKPLDVNIPRAIKLKNGNGMLIVAKGGTYRTNFHTLNFYKSEGQGNLDTLMVLKVLDENHRIVIDQLFQMENGDILLEGRDLNGKYDFGLSALSGSILIRFSAEDLGLKTSVVQVPTQDKSLTLFPNPAKDKINIPIDDGVVGKLSIYDILGQKVAAVKRNGKQKELDVSKLTSGIYSVVVNTKEGKTLRGSFVKE